MAQRGGKLKVTRHPCCVSSERDVVVNGMPHGRGDLHGLKLATNPENPFVVAFKRWAQTRSCIVTYTSQLRGCEGSATEAERILDIGNPEETPSIPAGVLYRVELPIEEYGAYWFWFGIPESADKIVLLRFFKRGLLDQNIIKNAERIFVLKRWKNR